MWGAQLSTGVSTHKDFIAAGFQKSRLSLQTASYQPFYLEPRFHLEFDPLAISLCVPSACRCPGCCPLYDSCHLIPRPPSDRPTQISLHIGTDRARLCGSAGLGVQTPYCRLQGPALDCLLGHSFPVPGIPKCLFVPAASGHTRQQMGSLVNIHFCLPGTQGHTVAL